MHKLLSKDLTAGKGICIICGPVTLAFRDAAKTKARCSVARDSQRVSSHGLSRLEARALKENAVCAVCGHAEHLVIDHCHSSGKVRDVLCNWCNLAIGHFRDNPALMRLAADYVEAHS